MAEWTKSIDCLTFYTAVHATGRSPIGVQFPIIATDSVYLPAWGQSFPSPVIAAPV